MRDKITIKTIKALRITFKKSVAINQLFEYFKLVDVWPGNASEKASKLLSGKTEATQYINYIIIFVVVIFSNTIERTNDRPYY